MRIFVPPAAMLATVCMLMNMTTTGAAAGTVRDGFRWLSENEEILPEGIIWNDAIGDGKDRYKSGGITQGWMIPEGRLTDEPWLPGFASGLEVQLRAFIATPENTFQPTPESRPFAEYAGFGTYFRTVGAPRMLARDLTRSVEFRGGIELGIIGDPVPLLELQDLLHTNDVGKTQANTLGREFLANAEARYTWRFHQQLNDTDLEFAPFIQGSAGMRENSLRLGGDIIYGSSLEGRLWNHDLATGAMIPGGSQRREGPQTAIWLGGDVGFIGSDALLDGGFNGEGRRVGREPVTGRLRAGILFDFEDVALGYSLTLLTEEFDTQTHSQVIGALTIKVRW